MVFLFGYLLTKTTHPKGFSGRGAELQLCLHNCSEHRREEGEPYGSRDIPLSPPSTRKRFPGTSKKEAALRRFFKC
jgi:hypothetical protein